MQVLERTFQAGEQPVQTSCGVLEKQQGCRGTGVNRRESRGGEVSELKRPSLTFWHQGPVSWKTIFPQTMEGKRGCLGDNSTTFHVLCTLLLLLFHCDV